MFEKGSSDITWRAAPGDSEDFIRAIPCYGVGGMACARRGAKMVTMTLN